MIVCECRFPVYGSSPVCRGPMDDDVSMLWASVWLVS